jgi:DNA mismatch repair protein MutL
VNSSSESFANEAPATYNEMRYVGRVFGLFILIEWADRLYIIDQHAAHERILYDKFLSLTADNQTTVPKQELLAPIPFSTENDEEDAFLEANREEFSRLGVDIEKDDTKTQHGEAVWMNNAKRCSPEKSINGEEGGFASAKPAGAGWQITALPSEWRMSDTETVKEILELQSAGENMAKRWAATYCCRAAIKDGDWPDDETAFELGKQALALPQPRCPHGRPVWTEISREALFKAVRRE